MENLNREFLAWLAGFWEGEGNLTIIPYKGRDGHTRIHTVISIAQTDKNPIEMIRSEFGGHIYECRRKNPNHNLVFRWVRYDRVGVINIVDKILPFLKFRQPEVKQKLSLLREAEKNGRYHRWTPIEIDIVKKNWMLPDPKIAKLLPFPRGRRMIQDLRLKLGLKKPRNFGRWETTQRNALRGLISEVVITETYKRWLEERGGR